MYKYKYAYFTNKDGQKVVCARATFAGKTVKAYAKCDPRDDYDEAIGEVLAAARCEAKIAQKRVNYAAKKVVDARKQANEANRYLDKMIRYQADARKESEDAQKKLAMLNKKLG